jgi:hypothetical protein
MSNEETCFQLNGYRDLTPRANLNLKMSNEEDQFLPTSVPLRFRDRGRAMSNPKYSLFEYFLAYVYPKALLHFTNRGDEILKLFLENGARYPSDPKSCNSLLAEYRLLLSESLHRLEKLTQQFDIVGNQCRDKAGQAIWDSPVTEAYLPEFLARAYTPGATFAKQAKNRFVQYGNLGNL